MTDTTESGRSVRKSPRRWGRLLVIVASACLMVGGAIGGYLLGRELALRPLTAATELLQILQPENQKLKTAIIGQNGTIAALQAELKNVQAKLEAIMPTKNTYKIVSNQSMVVADGRLTIGLIGPPTNENVTININGKQHAAVTGDTFEVAPDPATRCEVRVQAFDMFEAIVTASCAAEKP